MNTTTHTPDRWTIERAANHAYLVTSTGNSLVRITPTSPEGGAQFDKILEGIAALARFPDPAKDVAELVDLVREYRSYCDDLRGPMARSLDERARALLARLTDGRPVAK